MLKRAGVLALILAAGAAILPTAALAQDGYYYPRDNYYQRDRDWDRREAQRWREHEWREHRAEEWREHEWRNRRWREHERWEHRYDRDYHPGSYLYFGYGR